MRCPGASRRRTSSAARAWWSRSGSRSSRGWRPRAPSSRRGLAGRRSSSRRTWACWSTPRARARSSTGSAVPPSCLVRTRPAARRRPPTTSGSRRSGWRRSSSEPLEVGKPDLDERPDALLEPRLACERERLLVGRPDLLGGDALLQAVIARDEQLLDPLADLYHTENLAGSPVFE